MGIRPTSISRSRFDVPSSLAKILLCSAGIAVALPIGAAPARAAEGEVPPSAPNLPGPDDSEDPRVDQLQQQVSDLAEKLKQAEEERARAKSPLSIHGYVDFGFFAPNGNHGVGFIEDVGNIQFPQYSQYAWTFLGDILATAVNSRGEVASLGSPPGVIRFDSVNSDGAPGFIANEVNLRLGYALSDSVVLRTSVNFVPRSGRDFALGDFVDVDLAEMEYVVTDDGNTSIFVGKTLPVFGIEYKERKSDQRFGITPSLVQRYTSGPQLGVKVRSKLLQEWLIVAGSATNNSSGTEQFHFQSEIDKNSGKTLNGRLAISVPLGALLHYGNDRLELGGSGEWGSQDWAPDNAGKIWFIGADLQYLSTNFALKAQMMKGKAPGTSDGVAWQLDLHTSGYVEFNWQVVPQFGFLARVEQRDAFVGQGMVRAYLTKERRYTGGVRFVFNPHMMLKAEYLINQEYGGISEFKNDMFTSSLVLAY
ncbi:MAG: hypothetical protein ABUL77_00725 [Bacteroidota bacterium]